MASTHSTWARKLWLSLKGLHRLRFRTVWIHWVFLCSSAAVQSWLPLSSTSVTEEKVVGETKLCGFQERLFLYTRGWKLNNWITIIHYSLFFPQIIHYSFQIFPLCSLFIFWVFVSVFLSQIFYNAILYFVYQKLTFQYTFNLIFSKYHSIFSINVVKIMLSFSINRPSMQLLERDQDQTSQQPNNLTY